MGDSTGTNICNKVPETFFFPIYHVFIMRSPCAHYTHCTCKYNVRITPGQSKKIDLLAITKRSHINDRAFAVPFVVVFALCLFSALTHRSSALTKFCSLTIHPEYTLCSLSVSSLFTHHLSRKVEHFRDCMSQFSSRHLSI